MGTSVTPHNVGLLRQAKSFVAAFHSSSAHQSIMPVQRIDGFGGDDYTYALSLFDFVARHSLPHCTRLLEERVAKIRQTENSPSGGYATPPPERNEVVFRHWNAPDESKQSPSATKLQTRQVIEKFLESMPATEEQWHVKRESVGLSSADNILGAVDSLSSYHMPNLQDVLVSMARHTHSLVSNLSITRSTAHLMSLIFIATCCVALHGGHPQDLVEAAQRLPSRLVYFEHCEAGSQQLGKYRAAVRWLLQEIQRQCQRGLGHRAFEIFINGTETPRSSITGLT